MKPETYLTAASSAAYSPSVSVMPAAATLSSR